MVSLFLFRRGVDLNVWEYNIGKDLKIRLVLNYFVIDRFHWFKFNEYHDDHGSNGYWLIRWGGNLIVVPHFTLIETLLLSLPKTRF
jgi:hypothetical protein